MWNQETRYVNIFQFHFIYINKKGKIKGNSHQNHEKEKNNLYDKLLSIHFEPYFYFLCVFKKNEFRLWMKFNNNSLISLKLKNLKKEMNL